MSVVRGPFGGVTPSATPLEVGAPPILFGGVMPPFYFVSPVTTFQAQADKNACTAHAGSRLVENHCRARGVGAQVCRADLYSYGLYLDGREGQDVGVSVASLGRAISHGVLSEYDRPYGTDDVTRRTDPTLDPLRARGLTAVGLAIDVSAWKSALLVSGGVGFPHEVRSNYEPDAQGVVPPPVGSVDGYHITAIEGWDDARGFLMAQSWGPTKAFPNYAPWGIDHPLAATNAAFGHLIGKRGYCWLPYTWVRGGWVFEPLYLTGTLEIG